MMTKRRDRKVVPKATSLEKTTPPPAPDEDRNSGRRLPGVYELCHLAVTLRGSDAEEKPLEAVKASGEPPKARLADLDGDDFAKRRREQIARRR